MVALMSCLKLCWLLQPQCQPQTSWMLLKPYVPGKSGPVPRSFISDKVVGQLFSSWCLLRGRKDLCWRVLGEDRFLSLFALEHIWFDIKAAYKYEMLSLLWIYFCSSIEIFSVFWSGFRIWCPSWENSASVTLL